MNIIEAEATKMPWGEHKGKTLGEIAAAEITYIDFLMGAQFSDFLLRSALATVAEKHGRKAKVGTKSTGGNGQMSFL